MPYYIVDKTLPHATPDDVSGLTAYTSRDEAFAVLASNRDADGTPIDGDTRTPRSHKVVYIATETERANWLTREARRFGDGTYRQVPWAGQEKIEYIDHFVHLSIERDAMIAYTPTPEHGYADRQVRVRPGKYLAEFYSDRSKQWRDEMTAKVQAELETLKFACTPDEIETVYENAVGFVSCMGPSGHTSFDYQHPTRVYGDSDLAIAYMGPIDAATARCVVWPERKLYSRVYGLSHLIKLLEDAGYQAGSMRGAYIRQVYEDGNLILPYIDGVGYCDKVQRDGRPMLRLGSGRIACDYTQGYVPSDDHEDMETCENCGDRVEQTDRHSHCSDCAERYHTCDHCGDHFWADPDEADQTTYCDTCENNRSYCEVCDSDTWETTHETVHGRYERTACDHCARHSDESKYTCEVCDDDDREWLYDLDTQRERIDNGFARRVCEDCVQNEATICHVCRYAYMPDDHDSDACPECKHVPRCPHTGDLLDPDLANDSDLQRAREIAETILQAERLRRELIDSARTFHETGILTEVSAHA